MALTRTDVQATAATLSSAVEAGYYGRAAFYVSKKLFVRLWENGEVPG